MSWKASVAVVLLLVAVGHFREAEACATAAKVASVGAVVDAMLADLGQFTSNETLLVQNLCQNQTIKTAMKSLETDVKACPELLTNLSAKFELLQVGGQNFSVLLTTFNSVDQFCTCAPFLSEAARVKGLVQTDLVQNVANGYFTKFISPATVCPAASGFDAMATGLKAAAQTCPPILKVTGIMSVDAIDMMLDIKTKLCANFNATTFSCVTDGSAKSDFKSCMPTSTAVSDDLPCKRRDCVDKWLKADKCAAGNIAIFKAAVNAHAGKMLIKLTDDNCDGAATIHLSFLLVVACAFIRFFM